MSKLVSILIPAYNAEKWIKDTIESALGQTWQNKEIIIADDGSTDGTLAIAKSFEGPSVKVVTQENKGASAARNKALSLAQGDYIQWLDADDLLAPSKIALQMANPQDGNFSKTLLSSSFATFYYRLEKAKSRTSALWRDLTPIEYFYIKFNQRAWMSPSVWLVSRKLTELAGPWDERLSLDDDGEYFSRVVTVCDGIKFIPEAKVFYRQCNTGSLSRRINDKAYYSLFLSRSLCIGYMKRLEDSDRIRNTCLKCLQDLYILYYPEKVEFVKKIQRIAQELGGNLLPPRLKWNYSIIKNILGWKITKRLYFSMPKLKVLLMKNFDMLVP